MFCDALYCRESISKEPLHCQITWFMKPETKSNTGAELVSLLSYHLPSAYLKLRLAKLVQLQWVRLGHGLFRLCFKIDIVSCSMWPALFLVLHRLFG